MIGKQWLMAKFGGSLIKILNLLRDPSADAVKTVNTNYYIKQGFPFWTHRSVDSMGIWWCSRDFQILLLEGSKLKSHSEHCSWERLESELSQFGTKLAELAKDSIGFIRCLPVDSIKWCLETRFLISNRIHQDHFEQLLLEITTGW